MLKKLSQEVITNINSHLLSTKTHYAKNNHVQIYICILQYIRTCDESLHTHIGTYYIRE